MVYNICFLSQSSILLSVPFLVTWCFSQVKENNLRAKIHKISGIVAQNVIRDLKEKTFLPVQPFKLLYNSLTVNVLYNNKRMQLLPNKLII